MMSQQPSEPSPSSGTQVATRSPELVFYEEGEVMLDQTWMEPEEEDDSLCTIEDFKRRGLIVDTNMSSPQGSEPSLERSPLNITHQTDEESVGTGLSGSGARERLEAVFASAAEDMIRNDEAWWEEAVSNLGYPSEHSAVTPNELSSDNASEISTWLSGSTYSRPGGSMGVEDRWGFPVIAPTLVRVDPDTGLSLSEESKQSLIRQWDEHRERCSCLGDLMIPQWESLACTGASNVEVSVYARKGLPDEIRAQVWRRLCAAHVTRIPGEYQQLLKIAMEHPECNNAHEAIEKDVERTFPEHRDFRPGQKGVAMLRHVLNAYSLRNPGIGYCQGMNFGCALLLLVLKEEEEAYWALSALVEGLVPNYFDELIMGSVVDQCVLASLIREHFPESAAQMEYLGVDLPIICMQWFNSLFIETMPFSTVVCLWDALLSEGGLGIIRISLAIFERNKELIETSDSQESLIVGVRHELHRSFDGLGLLEAAYREGSVSFSLTSELLDELRQRHEKQVWSNLSRVGEPWVRGKGTTEGQEEKSSQQLPAPTSLVRSLSEAAADLYAGKVRGEDGQEPKYMMDVLSSASSKVGDMISSSWGALTSSWVAGQSINHEASQQKSESVEETGSQDNSPNLS